MSSHNPHHPYWVDLDTLAPQVRGLALMLVELIPVNDEQLLPVVPNLVIVGLNAEATVAKADLADMALDVIAAHIPIGGGTPYDVMVMDSHGRLIDTSLTPKDSMADLGYIVATLDALESGLTPERCDQCHANLRTQDSVARTYVNKDEEDADEILLGQYVGQSSVYESGEDLPSGRFNVLDDSDHCAQCSSPL
ncbi:hypothetical protein AB6D11_18530 [Vibrio splendidus]